MWVKTISLVTQMPVPAPSLHGEVASFPPTLSGLDRILTLPTQAEKLSARQLAVRSEWINEVVGALVCLRVGDRGTADRGVGLGLRSESLAWRGTSCRLSHDSCGGVG